jgi:hypothetical protein
MCLMLCLFQYKMILTKSFSKKNFEMIFSKIFSSVWFARKNYERQNCNCCRNLAMSGHCCQILASVFGRIRSKWLDSGRTHPDPVRSGKIRPGSGNGRILASFGRHPATVAGFRHRQDSGGWMLPDSGPAWILTTDHCRIRTIGYQTCVQERRV